MTATLRVPRTRGALSGALLVLLGLWGGFAALVGPYFDFAFAPDRAWSFTSGRVWLELVPAAAVLVGGLILLVSANRATAALGAWLAALGGAWYVVGAPLSALWAGSGNAVLGPPLGGTGRQVAERLALLYGLGAVTVFFAALALGRLAVVGVRDARLAERRAAAAEPVPAEDARDTAVRDDDVRDTDVPGTAEYPAAGAGRTGPIHATRPLRRDRVAPPAAPPLPTEETRAGVPADRKVAGAPAEETGRPAHRQGPEA